jgi:hypothetical protein
MQYRDVLPEAYLTTLTRRIGLQPEYATEVFVNPTPREIREMKLVADRESVKALLLPNDDVVMWAGHTCHHGDVMRHFKFKNDECERLMFIPDKIIFYGRNDEDANRAIAQRIKENRILRRWIFSTVADQDGVEYGDEPVSEAINDFQIHGDISKPGTFRVDDIKKFNDPVWKDRVVRLFAKSPIEINLHIINGDEEGRVTLQTKYSIDRVYPNIVAKMKQYVGLQSMAWVSKILGRVPDHSETSLNVLLMGNEGLTPWIVAHRIGHCFFENNNREVNGRFVTSASFLLRTLGSYIATIQPYLREQGLATDASDSEAIIAATAKLLSPFRSARFGHLRDSGEYGVELFAQYLITGRATFLRDWIGGSRWNKPVRSPAEELIMANMRNKGYAVSDLLRSSYADELRVLFNEMKGDPARPRTTKALYAIISDMVENERHLTAPKYDAPKSEHIHHKLDELEDTVNEIFDEILKISRGYFVVL